MDDAMLDRAEEEPTGELYLGADDLVAQADALLESVSALRELYARLDECLSALPAAAPVPTDTGHKGAAPAPGRSRAEDPAKPEERHLVALNLALSGRPVEEIDAYLLETFGTEDNTDILSDYPVGPSPAPQGGQH